MFDVDVDGNYLVEREKLTIKREVEEWLEGYLKIFEREEAVGFGKEEMLVLGRSVISL